MEPALGTINDTKARDEIGHGPRGKPNTIILLNNYSNKHTYNEIFLCPDQYSSQPSSEKLRLAVERN